MLKHFSQERILRWVTSRDTNGFPIPVWGYGPPGGGKTHMAEQIAAAIGAEFIPMSFGPTTTDTRVLGFLSAAQGSYIPGPAYGWYKNGGLWFLDELDNCEPSALVSINALLANSAFRFPNGELVQKHKDTYCLAGANTLGTGAQNGFRRQSQDAAARSRWAKVAIPYDEELERNLADNKPWTDYVLKVRNAVARLAKSNIHITPRDSIIGAAGLRNGIDPQEVVDHLLAELSEDAKKQILNEVGMFNPKPQVQQEKIKVADLGDIAVPLWWTQNKATPQPDYPKASKKIREYE